MFSFWYFGHMKIKLSWIMSSLHEQCLVTVKVLYSLTLYYIGGYIVHGYVDNSSLLLAHWLIFCRFFPWWCFPILDHSLVFDILTSKCMEMTINVPQSIQMILKFIFHTEETVTRWRFSRKILENIIKTLISPLFNQVQGWEGFQKMQNTS